MVDDGRRPYGSVIDTGDLEVRGRAIIAVRPRVGIVVFNSQQEPGSGEAVYMAATAGELTGVELDRGLEIYLAAAPFGKGPEVFRPPGRYRAYRAR